MREPVNPEKDKCHIALYNDSNKFPQTDYERLSGSSLLLGPRCCNKTPTAIFDTRYIERSSMLSTLISVSFYNVL